MLNIIVESFKKFIKRAPLPAVYEAVRRIDNVDDEMMPISPNSKNWGWINPTGKAIQSKGKYRNHDHMIGELLKTTRSNAFKEGWARFAVDAKMTAIVEFNAKFRETVADALNQLENVHAIYLESVKPKNGLVGAFGFTSSTIWKADSVAEAIRFLKYSDQF